MLREDKYPIPRIEDIFIKKAGGKRFSKIDLKDAADGSRRIFKTIPHNHGPV